MKGSDSSYGIGAGGLRVCSCWLVACFLPCVVVAGPPWVLPLSGSWLLGTRVPCSCWPVVLFLPPCVVGPAWVLPLLGSWLRGWSGGRRTPSFCFLLWASFLWLPFLPGFLSFPACGGRFFVFRLVVTPLNLVPLAHGAVLAFRLARSLPAGSRSSKAKFDF